MKGNLGALDSKSEYYLRTLVRSGKGVCILAFPCGSFATRMLLGRQLCHCHLISIPNINKIVRSTHQLVNNFILFYLLVLSVSNSQMVF